MLDFHCNIAIFSSSALGGGYTICHENVETISCFGRVKIHSLHLLSLLGAVYSESEYKIQATYLV